MRKQRLFLIGALLLVGGQAVVASAFAFGVAATAVGDVPHWPIAVAIIASCVVLVCLFTLAILVLRWWKDA